MVNLGVRGHDVTYAHDVESLGAALKTYGVTNVQLAIARSFPDIESNGGCISLGYRSTVRRSLASYGVEVAILGCYFNMIHPDQAVRREGIARFKQHLTCARSFGASIVASETGSVNIDFSYTENNFTSTAFREAVTVIRELVDYAERIGVTVGIEPGVNHPIHDIETTLRLIAEIDSPCLGIVLDPTALITSDIAEEQLAITSEAFERFGKHICALHLVDYYLEGSSIVRCNMGEGILDPEALIALSERYMPSGYVIMEFTEDEAISRAVKRFSQSF